MKPITTNGKTTQQQSNLLLLKLINLCFIAILSNVFNASAQGGTVDTIPPVIKLVGDSVVYIEVFNSYTDSGFTVTDNYYTSAQLKPKIVVKSNVDVLHLGSYKVTYDLTDPSGNKGKTVIRHVLVIDTVPPFVSLNGRAFDSVRIGQVYPDPGFTVDDNYDPNADLIFTFLGTYYPKFGIKPTNFLGTYTIIYMASDKSGNKSSLTRRVKVYDTTGNVIDVDTTVCKNSCPIITSPYAGKAYQWSTGATTRSIKFCPRNDSDLVVVITNNGKTLAYVYHVHVTQNTCVWPGDADDDGRADKNDLLAIGIAYGDSGVKRPAATTNWTGQPCEDWTKTFKSGENYKNADCNGNGVIDSMDVAAITKNYSKIPPKVSPPNGGIADPPLYVKFSKDSVMAGDTVKATFILGTSTIPASNVYGLKFSVNYSAQYIKVSRTLPDFSNCWIGSRGKDMIYLMHNDSGNGLLDIAVTRIDHKSMSGNGTFVVLGMAVPDEIGNKRWIDRTVNFKISDAKMINENGDELPLNALNDSIRAYKDRSGIEPGIKNIFHASLYPNPASQNLIIDAGTQAILSVQIVDILGNKVYTRETRGVSKIDISVSQMNTGIYSVIISGKEGSAVKHFVKD